MEKIKRLETLVSILSSRPNSSKQDILNYFYDHHELELSSRTLERDFKILETDFHIGVNYDRGANGYSLKDEDKGQITAFLEFAGRVYLADLFKKGFKDFQDLQKSVKLEDHSGFEGINNLEPVFLAIRQKRNIRFIHENYLRGTRKDYSITPFQIREYQGRWYVVGVPIQEGETILDAKHIQSFGLARIARLRITHPSTLLIGDFEHQLLKFSQIVGLNYDENDSRELIEIAATPNQFKYLQSLPLHPSQRKTGELPDGRVTFNLHLIPNYELKMQLLKFGPEIEVLSPAFLREQIKNSLAESLSNYDD